MLYPECRVLSLCMSSELFQNILSAVSATVDIFKNAFLLCHSATDSKKENVKASFQTDARSVWFDEINVLVSTYSGLGLSLWTTYQENVLSLQAFENYSLKSIFYFLLNLHLVKYSQCFFPLKKSELLLIVGEIHVKLFSPVTGFHLYYGPHNFCSYHNDIPEVTPKINASWCMLGYLSMEIWGVWGVSKIWLLLWLCTC